MSRTQAAETVVQHRLALGLEPVDAVRGMELVYPLRIEIEYGLPHRSPFPAQQFRFAQQQGRQPQALNRHNSGRYSLLYQPSLKTQIDLRLYDYGRKYVPRRLRVPLLTLQAVLALEAAQSHEYSRGRVRRPYLFPGAAYHHVGNATGLRGRVLRDGVPMRWVHVEAFVDDELVARARGDDRGEFLLLLSPLAAPGSDLSEQITVRLKVYGPALVPAEATQELASSDALWDLPLELMPAAGQPDEVAIGKTLPPGYVLGVDEEVPFQIARILSGREVDDFTFSLP